MFITTELRLFCPTDAMALRGTAKFINVGSYVSVGCLLVVLLTVIILVWSMPDVKHVDGNTIICVHEDGSLRCTETVTALSQLLEKEVKNVYHKTVKQDAVETKAYFENNVNIELKHDYLAAIPEMKPAAKVVGQLSKPQLEGPT
ncbi:uncharacterized protein LOC127836345 isoform X2 [Dreissena polymorpha]|uniref:uncharacterized protein LOC127836345 isoform X2 n=1 Tax=Dreissena polymorpha TaxID=45954 RepID=UPI00226464FF|nr:uncharacterized protein LOC127836345 isoform X2 [Dreissena polymorpha]